MPNSQAKDLFTYRTRQDEAPGMHFKGQIASSKFEMMLWRDGKSLRGNYFYIKSGSANSLDLRGKIDENGEFTIQEFDSAGKQTGEFTGAWKDDPNQSGVELEGEWKKPSAKEGTSFWASEQMAAFTNGAKIATISTSETFKPKRLDVSAQYPLLVGGGANTVAFNELVKAKVAKEAGDFKKLMLAQTAADLKFLPEGVNNYIDISFNVEYTDNDLISLSFLEGTFSGGAHGNANYFTVNYDLKNGKELKLADLFKPGAKYLGAIAAYSLKDLQSRTEGSENAGLAQDLWEDGAKPTAENYKSWNVTRKGLMFTFDPYQVGPYAAGSQFVIVPYAELKDLLKPDRMLIKMIK
ncbi:MAG: DUF3298 domain-containing protein [Pyrinomonadaceae bacterium]